MQLPREHKGIFILLCVLFGTPSVPAEVRLEMPNVLEGSREFSTVITSLLPLPTGGVIAATTSTAVALATDMTASETFNAALVHFPAAFDPNGDDLFEIGDLENCVWRLHAGGARGTFASPSVSSSDYSLIRCIAVQPDHKVLIGTAAPPDQASIFRQEMRRLNIDGSIDDSFQKDVSDTRVTVIRPLANGTILYAGGVNLNRLLPNGQLDSTFFVAPLDSPVTDFDVQPDGKIIIVGNFSTVNQFRRPHFARLNADGSVDLNFNPPSGIPVPIAVKLQSDGIVIANAKVIRRYFSNGILDKSFPSIVVNGVINAVAVDALDKIFFPDDNFLFDYSGRVRVRVSPANVPLVLERSSAIDSGWSAVQTIPEFTPFDYLVSDFPGLGSTFYRARPAQ